MVQEVWTMQLWVYAGQGAIEAPVQFRLSISVGG
jgi:hypothetical protein